MTLRTFTITIQKDGDWYSSWTDDVPGAFGQGRTAGEAKESIRKAIVLLFQVKAEEDARRRNPPVVIKKKIRVRV